MSELSERLNKIAEYYNLNNYSDFAKKTGLSHQTASNYLKGKQKPDAEKLAKIKQSFESVNGDWLLTGEGDMLKSDSEYNKNPIQDQPILSNEDVKKLIETNKTLSSTLENLSKTLENLTKRSS